MKIFVYANCQGQAFKTFLPQLKDGLAIRHVENWLALSGEIPVDSFLSDLREADVLIYQPIGEQHGFLSTSDKVDSLIGAVRPDCQLISFPYIYNDGLWPMLEEGGKVLNGSVVDPLLEAGAGEEEIFAAYDEDRLDFRFAERLENTVRILADREAETDVRVADFISNQFRRQELFLTQNHPTTPTIVEMINQVAPRLWDAPRVLDAAEFDPNIVGLPGRIPVDRYAHRELGLTYQAEPDEGAEHYFRNLLRMHMANWAADRAAVDAAA